MDIGVDPHTEIDWIDGLFKLRLVHLHEVVVALLPVAAKVVPHQVVDDTLGHPLGAQVTGIERLVAPLNPSSSRGGAVDQAQGADLIWVRDSETRQHVRSSPDSEANYRLEAKVRQHKQQLAGHFVHCGVCVAERKIYGWM